MTTLISSESSSGQRRRCDAKCYNAKHDKCTCICGGVNYGVGLQKAVENTRQMVKEFLQRPRSGHKRGIKNEPRR